MVAPSTAGETAPVTSVPAGVSSPMPCERRLEMTIAITAGLPLCEASEAPFTSSPMPLSLENLLGR